MTIRETYEYLLQIKKLEAHIQNAILQCESLRSNLLPAGIRYDTDRVMSSPDDKMSEIEAIVLDMEKEIKQLRQQKQRAIVQVTESLHKLSNDEERSVLMLYYIGKRPMEEIATEIPCNIRTAYKIKKRAIQNLSRLI